MTPRQPVSIYWCYVMFQYLLLPDAIASTKNKMEGFIVGGSDASIQQWPFITFIEIAKDNRPMSACGGSLISSQTVLTAAHCLDDVTSSKLLMKQFRFTIFMGHSIYKQASMSRVVLDYVTPSDYDPYDRDVCSDIGVMFLETPVKFAAYVKKVILRRKFDINNDRKLEVAGWGSTVPYALRISNKLKSAGITPISIIKCQAFVGTGLKKVICANVSQDYAYNGDSGGPLVIKDTHFQLGIVSFRDERSGITVYTSVPDYFNWIRDTQSRLFIKYCGKAN